MADRYRNFADLAAHEKENLDFRIRSDERYGAAAVIAPHGGGIEPGTSELAEADCVDDAIELVIKTTSDVSSVWNDTIARKFVLRTLHSHSEDYCAGPGAVHPDLES